MKLHTKLACVGIAVLMLMSIAECLKLAKKR